MNPIDTSTWSAPWVQLKYLTFNPCIFPAMLRGASPDAKAGDLVTVYKKTGEKFGAGLYNPRARVPLRILYHGTESIGETYLDELMERALHLRLNLLKLPQTSDSFRVIHSDGDGLSGLVIDKYADVLSVEVHSLGMYQRLSRWLPMLHSRLGTQREIVAVEDRIARFEGIRHRPSQSGNIRSVRILENQVRYEVDFANGHKTGFFCDQRENRHRFSQLVKGARVLDLCCYTGGFAISAMAKGEAAEVIGVDLDEKAIAQAKRNANLNMARVTWVHCDAFSYARQMQKNGEKWDVVLLDPPKFVDDREEMPLGMRKYEDLNTLGVSLTKPGGILVTCSCSGLVDAEQFESMVVLGAHRMDRRLQIFDRTGPGGDHPVMSNCPESRYLKLIWARVY